MSIASLKSQARNAYTSFYNRLDTVDCGIAMLKEFSPDAARDAAEYNAAMEQLRELDPDNFPANFKPL